MSFLKVVAVLFIALGGSVVLAADTLSSAESAVKAEKYSLALATLERLDAREAKEPRARFLRGTALAGIGRLDEAAAVLEKLIAEQPRMPEALNNLAMVYARQGKNAQAKQLLERAIRVEDRYATIHDNLNAVYEGMARNSYAKALRIETAAPAPRLELMRALPPEEGPAPLMTASAATSAPQSREVLSPQEESVTVQPRLEATSAAADTNTPTKPEQVNRAVTVAPAAPRLSDTPVAVAAPQRTVALPQAKPLASQLEERLMQWAAAWSAKDVDGYLSFYADDFVPAEGGDHDAWAAERRERLNKPEWIKIKLENLRVRQRGNALADVTLTQHYDAPGYSDSSVKRIRLALRDGQWVIINETTLSARRR